MKTMKFKTKSIQKQCLAEQFKVVRERKGITLFHVAEETRIQKHYIEAMELGQYDRLPQGFVERFVEQYARYLRIDPEKALAWYRVETLPLESDAPEPLVSEEISNNPFVIPFVAIRFFLVLLIGIFLSYLGFEIYGVLAPPELVIHGPSENFITEEHMVMIEGNTTPESSLLMNGQSVAIDEQGHFAQEVALKDGVNLIRIEARKDQGRANVIFRKILVENS